LIFRLPDISADELMNATHSGWLTKRGNKIKEWQKRWYVLKGRCLYYFPSKAGSKCIGLITLPNYKVVQDGTKKNSFNLVHKSAKTYKFVAPSHEDMQRWTQILTESIEYETKQQRGSGIYLASDNDSSEDEIFEEKDEDDDAASLFSQAEQEEMDQIQKEEEEAEILLNQREEERNKKLKVLLEFQRRESEGDSCTEEEPPTPSISSPYSASEFLVVSQPSSVVFSQESLNGSVSSALSENGGGVNGLEPTDGNAVVDSEDSPMLSARDATKRGDDDEGDDNAEDNQDDENEKKESPVTPQSKKGKKKKGKKGKKQQQKGQAKGNARDPIHKDEPKESPIEKQEEQKEQQEQKEQKEEKEQQEQKQPAEGEQQKEEKDWQEQKEQHDTEKNQTDQQEKEENNQEESKEHENGVSVQQAEPSEDVTDEKLTIDTKELNENRIEEENGKSAKDLSASSSEGQQINESKKKSKEKPKVLPKPPNIPVSPKRSSAGPKFFLPPSEEGDENKEEGAGGEKEAEQKLVPTTEGRPREFKLRPKAKSISRSSLDLCLICRSPIHQLEKVLGDGKVFHKNCFKCKECFVSLTVPNFVLFNGSIYCKPHAKILKNKQIEEDNQNSSSEELKQSTDMDSGSFKNIRLHIINSKCSVCLKTVYPVDKITADGKDFHKTCFRCQECKKVLSLANYAALSGIIYCKPHFKQLFKTYGNFDEGFGREKANWQTKTN